MWKDSERAKKRQKTTVEGPLGGKAAVGEEAIKKKI